MPPTSTGITYKSPLHQMTQCTPTCLWNDSVSLEELTYAIEHGGVGATCNPAIVVEVLQKEMHHWRGRIQQLITEMPAATEHAVGWRLVEEMSQKAAELLRPIFDGHKGRNGRLSIQTDPRFYRDTNALLQQALRFHALAPNMIVKLPVTKAGVKAIEEAAYQGVTINATVSFTLSQAIAVAEAMERGFKRREREGKDVSTMGPVCTLMLGRLDDWLKVVAEKRRLNLDPQVLEWAGVAVAKKAYSIYRERGYRIRIIAAAFRNDLHWSELIGGDLVISPPHRWQVHYNASDIEVKPRIQDPVPSEILHSLLSNFEDFRRAYDEDGLAVDDFDSYPPTVRTLRQFINACHELDGQIRDIMLPNPDEDVR